MSISQIITQSSSDKDKPDGHSYGAFYESVLSQLTEVDAVLELGVWKGDSLRIWSVIWPNAEVWGLDIKPEFEPLDGEEQLIVETLNCSDRVALKRFAKDHPLKFSLIVDDASHLIEDQLLGLELLWSTLKVGGLYVIEDLQSPRAMNLLSDKGGMVLDLRNVKGRGDDVLCWFKKDRI